MPPKSTIVVLMRPVDFTGNFVFHCHVTFHEDHGMHHIHVLVSSGTTGGLSNAA